MADPPYRRAGFANENAYRKARAQAQRWSDRHSRSEQSRYKSSMKPETFRAYFDAYASEATGTTVRRRRASKGQRQHLGPSKYVRRYLVNVTGRYTSDEFSERYSAIQ